VLRFVRLTGGWMRSHIPQAAKAASSTGRVTLRGYGQNSTVAHNQSSDWRGAR
jgi:hypothetical protein